MINMKDKIDYKSRLLAILHKYKHYDKFPTKSIVQSIVGDNYGAIHPPTLHIYMNLGNNTLGTL